MSAEYKPGKFICEECGFETARRIDAIVHDMDNHPEAFQEQVTAARQRNEGDAS